VVPYVSEEGIASIFRVKELAKHQRSMKQVGAKLTLQLWTYSFKSLVEFQQAAQLCIPEDRTLHNHCCENLKSYRDYNTVDSR
jgi:hypothetical protein